MSLYTVPTRSCADAFCTALQKNASQSTFSRSNRFGHVSENEKDNTFSLSLNKTKEINRTYVISACKKASVATVAPKPEGRFALQRRNGASKETISTDDQFNENTMQDSGGAQMEKRLTLQRRVRTGSIEKCKTNKESVPRVETSDSAVANSQNVFPLSICTDDSHHIKPGFRLVEGQSNVKMHMDLKNKDGLANINGSSRNGNCTYLKYKAHIADAQTQYEVPKSAQLIATKPINRTPAIKLNEKDFNKLSGKEKVQNSLAKHGYLGRQGIPWKGTTEGMNVISKCGIPQNAKSPAISTLKNRTPCHQVIEKKQMRASNSLSISRSGGAEVNNTHVPAVALKEETPTQIPCTEEDAFKVENSKVTVAVRVRPFSNREKNEKSFQVVSMNGPETAVQHPDTKQTYSFIYDFSFWSFDKCHPHFASQEIIYKTLAVPLLERAFEGYNTCLFAYGQTGSGKSYTMMGFGEEPGIIPRFCEDLFLQIGQTDTEKISYHLEMSYFEVYNEKIHDLLVFKAENGQKKQPLRVREHPVFGPYVEDLTANVVSSYSDVQSWLELGNKQRATAATGMNDKSSRSHSVFTLVMTQTKTEFVEEEQHDHRITSRINLIDLAGSERCSATQSDGERLKEGVSINKSLLTLGKVISALSEQTQKGKRIFIPYRESVLTWLLKESLGGNSKTTMISTISPAASYVEETLSTLRYAKQACLIINIAKVNEDVNAKLIRELKAEIEKLRAAQKNAQKTDPEKYRRYLQEITSLRGKLHQQDKDMAEMQRDWKEKLEQAEKRKFEETKELQKAGITFKMDNRLPNLVNLNEDPQLSELLLYMIKGGETTVGKYKPNSAHDIQLSGVLIADDHCIIKNVHSNVSITPLGEAKTYVNGKQILDRTILHHGDRVILGGDHYFRFNHPVEVQKVKRLSCGTTLSSDGPKDFEFAKNELLVAQRSQLESEIEEARLKAKEEMIQGIQIAKEMAQQELLSQKKVYESKIKSLEAELRDESHRKQIQEMNNQKAASKIQELEKAKHHLELEVCFNKKRLEMETLATKQALEDHTIHHAKILEALEAEKQKLSKEIQTLQHNHGNGDKSKTIQPNWNSLKLSVMIQEANTIGSKLGTHTVFCRHDGTDKESATGPSVQVQVRNLKLGIATFWSLEKFEYKLAAMKELYESNGSSKADDIFYDPADEWEPDLTATSVSSFSRGRSRSFMKNRRISDCLSGIKMHPIQNLHISQLSGSLNKSRSMCSNPSELFLPGICKELIGLALDILRQNQEEERSIADSLLTNLFTIHTEVTSISKAYKQQDEESQENLFSLDRGTQTCSIRITSAFEQLVVLTKHWLNNFQKCTDSVTIEELRQEIKNLGGYLQLLLQGCCSDIPSMVSEAQNKIIQTVKQVAKHVGHLVALAGSDLYFSEENKDDTTSIQRDFILAIYGGVVSGLEFVLASVQNKTREMQKELLKQYPKNEIQNQVKNNALALAISLEITLSDCKKKIMGFRLVEEESAFQEIIKATNLAAKYLELEQCMDKVCQIVVSSLQGSYRNTDQLRSYTEKICTLAGYFNNYCSLFTLSSSTNNPIHEIPRSCMVANELDSLAKALIITFELGEGQNSLKPQTASLQMTESQEKQPDRGETEDTSKQKVVPKPEYKLQSSSTSSAELSLSGIQWV
ncbi:kinesin-like protein KIF14 [Alligator mississippiensis]|uniref:kinesin-like protein KIF14 n=1 Tax=Alligator mississippiensis TaxID=8496 RepID=UPI0028775A7D|nr:kinesin-like protein KIF14 [Alligator mississippiensis]XP_059584425.1 kinesin-like protein KIF14 [Alligator mississippiensis]